MPSNAQLRLVAEHLDSLSSTHTTAPTKAGRWLRIALAAEELAGESTSANLNVSGYMLRAALALEAVSGTGGAEENSNYAGKLKRIVEALEVSAGVGSGTLAQRFTVAGQAFTAGPLIQLSSSSVSETATAGTAVGALTVTGGTGTWTFTEIAPLASSLAVAPGGAVTTVGTLTAGTQALAVQATNGTDTITRAFTMTINASNAAPAFAAIPAPGATAPTPIAGFQTYTQAPDLLHWGLDFGTEKTGSATVALATNADAADYRDQVLTFTTTAAGEDAYVAERIRHMPFDGARQTNSAADAQLSAGYRVMRLVVVSGEALLWAASSTNSGNTPTLRLGFADQGDGTFRFTFGDGTTHLRYGAAFAYGAAMWVRHGFNVAGSYVIDAKTSDAGSWSNVATISGAAVANVRGHIWGCFASTKASQVQYCERAWSNTGFAEIDRSFIHYATRVADATHAAANFAIRVPAGAFRGQAKVRVRIGATDPGASGGTPLTAVALTARADDIVPVALSAGLSAATKQYWRFDVLGAADAVVFTSRAYSFTTDAAPGGSASYGAAYASCASQTPMCHPYRNFATSVAEVAAGTINRVFLLGDQGYEGNPVTLLDGYLDGNAPETREDFTRKLAEYHSDIDLEALCGVAIIVQTMDDHEVANNSDGTWYGSSSLASGSTSQGTGYSGGTTIGQLYDRGISVCQSWAYAHFIARPADDYNYMARYKYWVSGTVATILLDTHMLRRSGKVIHDQQLAWLQASVAAIQALGYITEVRLVAQTNFDSYIKSSESWKALAGTEYDTAMNYVFATLSTGIKVTQIAGDAHYIMQFSRRAVNAALGTPANYVGELIASGTAVGVHDKTTAGTVTGYNLSTLTASLPFVRSSPVSMVSNVGSTTIDLSYEVQGTVYTHRASNTTADTTAPTLSSPSGTQTGPTTANLSVSTNEVGGTMYRYVSTSATPPSSADLIAGTGAVFAGSAAVSSTGAQASTATGLTASTAYYAHFLHRDAANNNSAIATSASFTTAAADTTDPTITSANTFTVAENSTLAHALAANETVAWTITGGADAADFEISGSTLRWAGNVTRDYEAPADADTNNTYVVQVTATDGVGLTASQTITVTVTDVTEGGGYTFTNSEAATLVAARTDSPDDTHKGHIDNLVGSLKSALGGLNFDRLYVPIAGDDASARLNYANPAVGALTGTATFTSGQGLTGSGTNALSTGLNANAGTHFGTTSGSMLVVIVAAGTNGNTMGIASGSANLRINPRSNSNLCQVQVNTTDLLQPSNSVAPGVYIAVRTSTAIRVYKDGVELGADTSITNSTPGAVDLTVFGANSSFCAHRCGAFGFGAEMNATQAADVTTAINTYLTARGVV
jgi:hypothetical protein